MYEAQRHLISLRQRVRKEQGGGDQDFEDDDDDDFFEHPFAQMEAKRKMLFMNHQIQMEQQQKQLLLERKLLGRKSQLRTT
jgi:hypothetical protein